MDLRIIAILIIALSTGLAGIILAGKAWRAQRLSRAIGDRGASLTAWIYWLAAALVLALQAALVGFVLSLPPRFL